MPRREDEGFGTRDGFAGIIRRHDQTSGMQTTT